jgi:hypothetical protein
LPPYISSSGADVAHAPPGVNRPSYSAIIGSVDSHTAKYVATSRAQTERREIINDMQEMCQVLYPLPPTCGSLSLTLLRRSFWVNIKTTK